MHIGFCTLTDVAHLDGGAIYLNNNLMPELPWSCDFGKTLAESEMCGFTQDTTDSGDWQLSTGPINRNDPGPPADSADPYSENSFPNLNPHFSKYSSTSFLCVSQPCTCI